MLEGKSLRKNCSQKKNTFWDSNENLYPYSLYFLFTLFFGSFAYAQDPDVSDNGVEPWIAYNNPSCASLGSINPDYSGAYGVKIEGDYNQTFTFTSSDAELIGGPPDPNSSITVWSTDGKYFGWSLQSNCVNIIGVIVKGGTDGNVYNYYPVNNFTSDDNLHAPVNSSGDPADISHIEFCYKPDCDIQCPVDITVDCSESTDPSNTGYATFGIGEGCDLIYTCPSVSINHIDAITPGNCDGNYVITRTWIATVTGSGITYTCDQTITVVDNTDPVLSGVPENLSVDCESVPAAAVVTATDNCSDIPLGVVFKEVRTDGNCAGNYTLTRTWTATDECGNETTGTQIITVTDVTGPVLAGVPGDISVDCESVPAAAVVTATDNCSDIPLGVVFKEVRTDGNCAGNYTLTRTWTATDECGNETTGTQIITVTDNTPPSITCPGDVTIDCAASTDPSNTGSATASDDCSGATVTYSDAVNQPDPNCASLTITRTWTATDGCGNASSCVQTITVVDNTPPSITCPPDAVVLCNESISPTNTGMATATDDCSGVTVTYSDSPDIDACGNGTITRTWTATDGCGNSTSCVQTITINDCSDFELLKTTDGAVDPTQTWSFTLTSDGGISETQSTSGDGDGILFDDLGHLSISNSYTVCETNIFAGWTSIWTINGEIVFPYNPNTGDPQADNSTLCYTFSLPIGTPPDCAFRIEVDNSYPGGAPRTPGYWKNWNSCSGGNQIETALNNGGCAEGFCTLDDFVDELIFCDGGFIIGSCEDAVALLGAYDIETGKNKSSDAAYTLMRALLAAKLNLAAGAETCSEVVEAVADAEALLCGIGFDGTGSYLRPKNAEYTTALELAATLDCYNNGYLCNDGDCSDFNNIEESAEVAIEKVKKAALLDETQIQVFPNPSATGVTIEFIVPEDGRVTLDIFNLTGQKVNRIFDAPVAEGLPNSVRIEDGELLPGTYIYRLYDSNNVFVGKIIIMD